MVPEYWHLAVVAAVVALIVWGLRAARRATLLGLAVTLIVVGGWLFWTLILDEEFVDHAPVDLVLIGAPAVIGVGLGMLALTRQNRAD